VHANPDPRYDLGHHGDRETGAGLVDLAVNVRLPRPPQWLLDRIAAALSGLAAYPDPARATAAVARRHGRDPGGVLLTSGGAEAFVLIARAVEARRPVVVHPQFTEPEAAMLAAGRRVDRALLHARDGFALDPALVPDDADLVFVGNPTNPTAVLHPAEAVAALARPGRTLVVDEAFVDAIPGEAQSLAARTDLPGLAVVRSLTKTWGLAGLRVGYVLAEPAVVERLRTAQPLWSVSTPALVAAEACSEPAALAEAEQLAVAAGADRAYLEAALAALPGVSLPAVVATPDAARAPFVLVETPGADKLRLRLRDAGFALRRADTFPGLGPDWLRIAVRTPDVTDALVAAWLRSAR
jgi:histidinol-phosphate aminotransferase